MRGRKREKKRRVRVPWELPGASVVLNIPMSFTGEQDVGRDAWNSSYESHYKKKKNSKPLFCSSLIRVKQKQKKNTRTIICYMFPILSLFRGWGIHTLRKKKKDVSLTGTLAVWTWDNNKKKGSEPTSHRRHEVKRNGVQSKKTNREKKKKTKTDITTTQPLTLVEQMQQWRGGKKKERRKASSLYMRAL